MIEPEPPRTWQDLQVMVARILQECGLKTEVERAIRTARGEVVIDVFAEDLAARLPTICLVECKHWKKRVPKSVVHSLRTVSVDVGSSHAMIVSSVGFQKGAVEAALHTNLQLMTYQEFEEYFEPSWTDTYLRPILYATVDPLIEYTEPINGRVFRKADKLSEVKQDRFRELRKIHLPLMALGVLFSLPEVARKNQMIAEGVPIPRGALGLPLVKPGRADYLEGVSDELKRERSARKFLSLFCSATEQALAEFDEIFGERA